MQHRLLMTLLSASLISFAATAPLADRAALPSLDRRLVVTSPGGIGIDTGSDVGDLAGFSPIEDGFLEGDNDAGGESDGSDGDGGGGGGSGAPGGGTAVGIANGLTGVGSGSASQNGEGSGSTSNACSLAGCSSAAQSSNGNSTDASTSSSSPTLINAPISGPLVSTGGRLLRRLFGS